MVVPGKSLIKLHTQVAGIGAIGTIELFKVNGGEMPLRRVNVTSKNLDLLILTLHMVYWEDSR